MKKGILYTILLYLALSLASCSATKFVPDGSYLLDEVKIHTDNKEIKPSDMRLYVRQNPNSKWFSTIKTQLYVYNWSGRDSTKWFNRFLRKIGDAPVIYNESDAIRSQEEIAKAVQNLGYMGASVKRTTKTKKKKLKLFYEITSGKPYIVRTLKYDISDKKIAEYLRNDSTQSMLREGMLFDVTVIINLIRITLLIQLTLPAIPIKWISLYTYYLIKLMSEILLKSIFSIRLTKSISLPIMMFCNRQL